ncbi:ABC transporter permease, partial [Leucobacter sp. OH2974_COT-288]
MYLALREFKFAKGRFSLIVVVVALMTLLVGFLTGIAGGLAGQNISALLRTGADQVVFAAATEERKMSYAESVISADAAKQWEEIDGVRATPLSIVNGAIEAGNAKKAIALFAGVDPDGAAVSEGSDIVLGTETAAALGVVVGDSVTLAGAELRVAEVTTDEFYSHLPVAWASLETAQEFSQSTRQEIPYATVMLLHQESDAANSAVAVADVAAATETQAEPILLSLLTLDAFKAQLGSLGMMIGMLIAIAALVIGVFFLVWSMQRQRDIAVLKALGAKTSWLVR